jgi:hypothetical protein
VALLALALGTLRELFYPVTGGEANGPRTGQPATPAPKFF